MPAVVRAAERLRAAGHAAPIVSMGSSPTALHARHLDGVTEVRAGVYMFGDLFQAEIGTHDLDEVALTVLTSVIGRRPGGCWWTPAGWRCRRTAAPRMHRRITASAWCWTLPASAATAMPSCAAPIRSTAWWRQIRRYPLDLPVGARLRIAPNHTCMTAAAHDRYFVVEGSDEVVAIWPRVNGW